MKTLLRIDASARRQGSHSRALADHFEACWRAAFPDGRVHTRDLALEPVPHLDQTAIAVLQGRGGEPAADGIRQLSDTLIGELESANDLLISSPLYNFAVPSTLKAYFDHVVRSGRTFVVTDAGYRGLLTGKRAFLITARGGTATPDAADDFQTPFLRTVLAFIGITDVDVITVDGTSADAAARKERLAAARARISRLLAPPPEPSWVGTFSAEDRLELSTLRQAQAHAIQRGDARAYADLCAEDVRLMIPGHDIIAGRDRFLAAEEALFRQARFGSFRKHPERIERSGDFAVETGRQEVTMLASGSRDGIFSARQKYTHVFRRTPQGWRFAVLMSNPSES